MSALPSGIFTGRTIVVTGASSGLGRALAGEFARQGGRLVLLGRDEKRLEESASDCRATGGEVITVIGDVTNPEDCGTLVDRAVEAFGGLDYLVLNAGVSMWARFEDVEDLTLFRGIMETNYLGAVNCTHHALPHLRMSRGMIVAISSIQGKIGVPLHTGYVASKHAVQGFFDSLRLELEGSGVDVLVVLPYWLQGTRMRRNAYGTDGTARGDDAEQPGRRAISLEICCRRIVAAMSGRKREIIVPSRLRAVLWLRALSPRLVDYLVRRRMRS